MLLDKSKPWFKSSTINWALRLFLIENLKVNINKRGPLLQHHRSFIRNNRKSADLKVFLAKRLILRSMQSL